MSKIDTREHPAVNRTVGSSSLSRGATNLPQSFWVEYLADEVRVIAEKQLPELKT